MCEWLLEPDAICGMYEMVLKAMEAYASQNTLNQDKEMENLLLQFGDFMWHCSDGGNDCDLAIGYNDNGKPNSVALIIHGRTHSEFTIKELLNQ